LQCTGDEDTLGTTWGVEADIDLVFDSDVIWDIISVEDDAGGIDSSGCAGGDVLHWRLTACDATAGNCAASTAATVDDLTILAMKMEYVTDIGD
jgi:hypothetical protein